ncbi:voltage-gated potassium channel [Aeromicrobium panaciterrae]|uniref:Voltage-gated potassium channel n=1 Tax=Aeromicrobium panaciterrae TaxID=363861 RepID=A0ABU1UJS8_9ACTN|nr:ion channel [Aeromicrobium panaciterrae]MDR7085442.1 voltage-gated potassium channel [Aeromicrobium panaciterrae]
MADLGVVRDDEKSPISDRLELLAVGLALAFLVAYALPILRPDSSSEVIDLCRVIVWATWALLAIEVGIRLWHADSKTEFFKSRWLDVLAVALPVLRPLRLLRLLVVLSALQRFVGHSLRGRIAIYVGGSLALTSFVGALAVLDAERKSPDANILNFGDAIWWVATTLSTVGYGDHYPVTNVGRGVAVALMIVGVAFLGVVTASLAAWLIEQVREIEAESDAIQRRDILAVHEEVRELRAQLAQRDRAVDDASPPED